MTGFRGSGDQLGTRRVVPDLGRDNVREHGLEPDEPGELACEVGWGPLVEQHHPWQQFPTAVRYTGVALTYNVAYVIGGLAPLAATSLYAATGTTLWTGAGMALLAVLAVTAMIFTPPEAVLDQRKNRPSPSSERPAGLGQPSSRGCGDR